MLQDWSSSDRKSRHEEVVLARLRLGTCLFNKKHIIPREDHPVCDNCQVDLTPIHVLVECPEFSLARSPIIEFLNREGLPLSKQYILNDHFPHDLLFKYLKDIQYINRV